MKDMIMNMLWVIERVFWIVIAILLIRYVFVCYGAEVDVPQPVGNIEVKHVAPDGVNIITTEIDGNGNVVGERSTAVYVAPKYIPQSGERVMIGDYEYVLIQSPDWSRITNAVKRLEAVAERRWTREHKTVEGRREWHGNHTNRVVSADGKTVTWYYADGYEHVEHATPVRTRTRPPKATGKPLPRLGQQRRIDLPDRLKAKREAIARQPPAREETVIFGPGGKVLKVEDGK